MTRGELFEQGVCEGQLVSRSSMGYLVDPDTIDKIALGSWQNEETFWKGLVERKKLHHLGDPDPVRNSLRDRLAIGHTVFAGRPRGLAELTAFIKDETARFLDKETLRRISFDLTNIETLSGGLGEGFFVIFELKRVVGSDSLFGKTSFYEAGKYLNWKRVDLRQHIDAILAASEEIDS